MELYIYHSPEGDRELIAEAKPEGNRITLINEDGAVEIANCEIADRIGGRSLVVDVDSSKPAKPKTSK